MIDGCPAGLPLKAQDIQEYLNRRKPGQSRYTTQRSEPDRVEILSGVFEDRTTGTPISLLVYNKDQHSKDYSEIASCYRPGHADYTFDAKYGFRDYRGGGRSSGRETIGRVAGGAVAARLLSALGISFCTYTRAIGPVQIQNFSREEIFNNKLYMPDSEAAEKASEYLESCMAAKNSAGGIIECVIHGTPAGLGEPVFDKLDASLAKAVMSIGAVKGVEIGDGFQVAASTGLTDNDGFHIRPDGTIEKTSIMPEESWAESATAVTSSSVRRSNRRRPLPRNSKPSAVPEKKSPSPSKDATIRSSCQERLLWSRRWLP